MRRWWLWAIVVAFATFGYLSVHGIDARMTRDSVRDFRWAYACAEFSECYSVGLGSTVGLLHGWLWMRLLVAAHLAGLSPLQHAAALLLQEAAAAGLVFLAVAPVAGRALGLWTTAIFVTMCEATGFPELTTAYVSFLPQAALYAGLARAVAGSGLGWSALAGLGLWACVDLHISSLALIPVFVGVAVACPPRPARVLAAAWTAATLASWRYSWPTYVYNFNYNPRASWAFLAGLLVVALGAAATRPWWMRRSPGHRLVVMSAACCAWWIGIEAVARSVGHVNLTPWNPIPIVTPMSVLIAVCSQVALERLGRTAWVLAGAGLLGAVASLPDVPSPLAPRWRMAAVATGLAWLTSSATPLGRVLEARNGSAAPRIIPRVASAAVLAIVIVGLAGVSPHRVDWDFVESASARASETLGRYLKEKGWSCAEARLAEGRDVLTGDNGHPFVCLLLDDVRRSVTAVPRMLSTTPAQVPAARGAGWDTLDFGRGRWAVVSSITPWVLRTTGHGLIERDGATLASFDLQPFWTLAAHPGDRDFAYRPHLPFALEELLPSYRREAFNLATVVYDFPIEISGSDEQREIDVLGSHFLAPRWKIAGIEGVEHVISPSGYHATLQRGGGTSGRIRFTHGSSIHGFEDVPVDLIETTPGESAIRALLPDRSSWP